MYILVKVETLPKAERFCSTFSKVEKKVRKCGCRWCKKKIEKLWKKKEVVPNNNNVDIKFEYGFVAYDGVSAFGYGECVRVEIWFQLGGSIE